MHALLQQAMATPADMHALVMQQDMAGSILSPSFSAAKATTSSSEEDAQRPARYWKRGPGQLKKLLKSVLSDEKR